MVHILEARWFWSVYGRDASGHAVACLVCWCLVGAFFPTYVGHRHWSHNLLLLKAFKSSKFTEEWWWWSSSTKRGPRILFLLFSFLLQHMCYGLDWNLNMSRCWGWHATANPEEALSWGTMKKIGFEFWTSKTTHRQAAKDPYLLKLAEAMEATCVSEWVNFHSVSTWFFMAMAFICFTASVIHQAPGPHKFFSDKVWDEEEWQQWMDDIWSAPKAFFFNSYVESIFLNHLLWRSLKQLEASNGFLQTYPTPNLWQVSRSGWVPRRLLAWMMKASRRPGQLLTYTWQGRHWSRCSTTEAALDFDGYEDLQDTSNWCRFCVLSLKVIYVQLLTQVLRGRHVGLGAETGGRDFNCWSWWFLGWKYQKMSLNTNHSLHFPFWCVGQVSTVVRKMSCGPSKHCWVSHAVHLAQVFYLHWNLIYNSFVLQAVMNTTQSHFNPGSTNSKAEMPEPVGIYQSLVEDYVGS